MTEKEFKELKVGDKVRIISMPIQYCAYGLSSMDKWCGKVMTVNRVYPNGGSVFSESYIEMREDNGDYFWFPEMIAEKVTDATIVMHLIKDGKTVIKLSDGRVGVAFCSPEDTFDEYEGVRLATARAYGKEPPAKKSKVKEVKRRAKVGEYIKIVNKSAFCVSYENGEIFKVECITPLGSAVVDLGNSFHMPMHEEEYVVLEGYKPKK